MPVASCLNCGSGQTQIGFYQSVKYGKYKTTVCKKCGYDELINATEDVIREHMATRPSRLKTNNAPEPFNDQ